MEGRLRLLSGEPGDEDVLWPLGDIQEAILYYQVRSRPDTLQLTVNGAVDNDATDNIQQSRFKSNSKCFHFRLGKRNNLSAQDPGRVIYCLCAPMTIAS